jgi:hypothetical protein
MVEASRDFYYNTSIQFPLRTQSSLRSWIQPLPPISVCRLVAMGGKIFISWVTSPLLTGILSVHVLSTVKYFVLRAIPSVGLQTGT